ncbi:MAG: AbrB/MazE/SpoVT family DNA-binding domain-containing protein [Chitinophagaceae bacterium]|nr:AbrB/MazE/SpoVT family DNA-binding domain-containing protein [Polaromonas sp.]
MNTTNAAVFISSNSQAVKLPMQFQLRSQRASISRRGNLIVLRESPLKVRDVIGHLPFVNDTPVDIDDQMPAALPSMDAVR